MEILEPLTKRQTKIAFLIADGFSDKEIGYKLNIASRTASNHAGQIRTKIGLDGVSRNPRVLLARWVWEKTHELVVLDLR